MDYTIYHKTDAEMDEERRESGFGKFSDPTPTCPHYIMTKKGERRNVWGLDTLEIYAFIKAAHAAGAENSFEIIDYLYPDQMIKDYTTLLTCMVLVPTEGELMRDFIGSMGGNKLRDEASKISEYMTKVEGRSLTTDEVIAKYVMYEKQQKSERS